MAHIGIFWFDGSTLLACKCTLAEGCVALGHIIDSPLEHWRVWQTLPRRAALWELDYQELPRGRVLFDKTRNRPLVYLDKSLLMSEYKQQIRNYFELNGKVSWRLDSHYCTNSRDINLSIFE